MKPQLLGSVVVILLHVCYARDSLHAFSGTWTVHHSDNFEAYLAQRNIPWFMRQMIKLAKLKRTYRMPSTDDKYECDIDTDNDKTIFWRFKLNKGFENEYLEGRNHTITISYNEEKKVMTEAHSYENNPMDPFYLYIEEGYLVMAMTYENVTTRRFYKHD